ncbi:MAG: hypothetical protein PVJ57_17720 [Phycisphaerae bacterium]|jgi:hypothetical protein
MSDRPCQHEPECRQDLKQVRETVYGNGHPEKSLIMRVEFVERQLNTIRRMSLATLGGVGMLVGKLIFAWLETLVH